MTESKLIFNVQELPEGIHTLVRTLGPADLGETGMDGVRFKSATVEFQFEKSLHFVKTDFTVSAELVLLCDRSLREYEHRVEESYQVLFKPGLEEKSVDVSSAMKPIDEDSLTLDLRQEVRDTILLDLPVRKIHPDYLDDDGKPTEFDVQSFGPEAEPGEDEDPRWAELKKLKRNS
ncbi:MAG: YceD family protein [Bacteroidota bacterium]